MPATEDPHQPATETSEPNSPLETVQCTFHDVEFGVAVSTSRTDILQVTVEQLTDSSQWHGAFSAKHVEEIAAKTGSFKSYGVFVKMLLRALKRESEHVVIDMLSYEDLDALQQRQSTEPPKPASLLANNKRYLIMTYISEFERIHYPLPLQYVACPDPEYLKSIIARLRSEAKFFVQAREPGDGKARGAIRAITHARHLRDENSALQDRLQEQQGLRAGLARASDEIQEREEQLQAVTAQCEALTDQLGAARQELNSERSHAQQAAESHRAEADSLRSQVLELGRQLHLHTSQKHHTTTSRLDSSGSGHRRRTDPDARPWRAAPSDGYDSASSRGRCRSAPPTPPPRFDPTAYVSQQRSLRSSSPGSTSGFAGNPSPQRRRTPSLHARAPSQASSDHSADERPRSRRSSSLDRLSQPTAASRARSRTPSPRPAMRSVQGPGAGRPALPRAPAPPTPPPHALPYRSNSSSHVHDQPRAGRQQQRRPFSPLRPSRMSDGHGTDSDGGSHRSLPLCEGVHSRRSMRPSHVSGADSQQRHGDTAACPPDRGGSPARQHRPGRSPYRRMQENDPSQVSHQRYPDQDVQARSPMRALRDVQQKLSEYPPKRSAIKQSHMQQAEEPVDSLKGRLWKPEAYIEPEIGHAAGEDEIDARLQKLQKFLQAAKAGIAPE